MFRRKTVAQNFNENIDDFFIGCDFLLFLRRFYKGARKYGRLSQQRFTLYSPAAMKCVFFHST